MEFGNCFEKYFDFENYNDFENYYYFENCFEDYNYFGNFFEDYFDFENIDFRSKTLSEPVSIVRAAFQFRLAAPDILWLDLSVLTEPL